MFNIHSYLWLVPALPLLAATLIAFLGPAFLRRHSHWPCVLACAGACVCSLILLLALHNRNDESPESRRAGSVSDRRRDSTPVAYAPGSPERSTINYYRLFQVGAPSSAQSIDIGVSFRADELTAIMLV